MKVIVAGCHGQLGQKLSEKHPDDVEFFGCDIQSEGLILQPFYYRQVDIADFEPLKAYLFEIKPEWIINAAAFTHVDNAETDKELCWKINVTAVENIVKCATELGIKVANVSTDYVFNGTNGPYGESDKPDPLGNYGYTKREGEKVLEGSEIHWANARTMVLYSHLKHPRSNFVSWLVNELAHSRSVKIVNDQIGNTTIADELAAGMWKIIENDYKGHIHIAGREISDRYTFALQIADVFGFDKSLIAPVSTAEFNQAAPRPLNSGLIVDKAINELGISLSDNIQGIELFKKQYENIKENG